MATYNFTVRATDNLGAYADRDFALTVNNTDISRFVLVGTTGLAHSTTGATWTVEAGLSGNGVAYGNGQWVVWTGLNSNVLRISPDAISWSTTANTFSGTPAGTYHTQAEATAGGVSGAHPCIGFSFIKWVGDKWVGMARGVQNSGGSALYVAMEYTSVDAINWTFARFVHSGIGINLSAPGVMGVLDFGYDAPTDTWVCVLSQTVSNCMIKYRVGNGEWQVGLASIPVSNTAGAGGSVINLNGLWVVSCRCNGSVGGQSLPLFTSIDGINWTPRAAGAQGVTNSLVYANGRLITFAETSTSASYAVRVSIDAGRTWVSQTTRTHGTSSNSGVPWSQTMAYYAGSLIWSLPTNGSYVARSTDDGTGVTTVNVSGIGSHMAIAARTT